MQLVVYLSRSRGHKFESWLYHVTFMEIDCDIIYTVILPLPLNQEGKSVTDESMYKKYWLTTYMTKPAQEKMYVNRLTWHDFNSVTRL